MAKKRSTTSEPAPKLLTGGNPQIPKADGDAPVQAYIAAMPGWNRSIGEQLDALVEQVVPDVRKAVRWNTPFYGVEGRGWFLGINCCTKYVKVSFLMGAHLQPQPPVGSKHQDVRYAHVFEGETINEAAWTEWIRQAAAMDGEHLF